MTTITVYACGTSGLSPSEAKRYKAKNRPEPQSGIVIKHARYACPECDAPVSLRYHNAGYVCDTCADKAENFLRPI